MGLLSRKKKRKDSDSAPVKPPVLVQQSHPHALYANLVTTGQESLDIAVAQVVSALEARGLQYDASRAKRLLTGRFSGGDPRRAINLAFVLRDAEDMILIEPSTNYLLGAENLRGTTCYLDALLFSMFSRTFPIFDALLYHERQDPRGNRLAVNLRVFVNLLRSGYLITHDLVDILRNSIADCGWSDARSFSQQDTSECFGFIAEMLQMPMLTFKVHIAHGGREDRAADHKLVQERFLALPVPERPGPGQTLNPIELVDLIDAHFHTKLEVRRPVARSRSTMMSGIRTLTRNTSSSYFGNAFSTSELPAYDPGHLAPTNPFYPSEKKAGSRHSREVSMQAWQLFELVPYYSATSSSPEQQDYAKQPPVVAICLKRYYFTPSGTALINPTPIIIPEFIDFTPFTDHDNTIGRSGRKVRLRLDSAVCHRGQQVGSGHYVSISRGPAPDQWLLFDDLAAQRVTQGEFARLFEIEVPYLLFYQLETIIAVRPERGRRVPSVPNFGNDGGEASWGGRSGSSGFVPPPYPVDEDGDSGGFGTQYTPPVPTGPRTASTGPLGPFRMPPVVPESTRPLR